MLKIRDLEDGLAAYIHVLSDSAERCRRAEDRPTYQHHLAEAARMFASLRGNTPLESVKAIVVAERRAYGRSFLSDEAGALAEAAFNRFASLVETS
jgi:hypothetical protein